MYSSIDKVRNRKKNNSLFIDGINYGRVIATQTYDYCFKSIVKEFIRLYAFNYKIQVKGNNDSNVCLFYSFKSSKRKDYDDIINLFRKSINNLKYVELIQYMSFGKILKKIYLLILNFTKFKLDNVNERFMCALVATQYMILKSELDKCRIFNNLEVVCTFYDAYGPENLLTQIANNKDIITVTLQHGQYRVLSRGNEVPDAEAYENFISNYMLSWGQATVDEFQLAGIDISRLVKVGALKRFSFNSKIHKQESSGVFGIVLSGEAYRKTNIDMINLANIISEKYNLKYILRMHPRNNKSFYLKYCKTEYLSGVYSNVENIEYAKKVDFSLIHMTGVFVELLSINSPIIVYKDSFLEKMFQIKPFCIENVSDFNNLYSLLVTNRSKFLEEQYHKYSYFNETGNILENYRIAIKSILEKNVRSRY